MGPWPQPRGQGPLWDFFLKEAARRHDSSLLKFRRRTPTEIQVPLLAAASIMMARISSYADIPGVGRAADAVEVGSRPWFRFCPAPLLPVRDVGTWAGSIDAVTSGTPARAADGGTGTPVAPPPSAPVVLASFFFGFLTGFGASRGASVAIMPSSAPLGQGSASDGSSTAPLAAASLSDAIGFCFPGLLLQIARGSASINFDRVNRAVAE
jgi:hypothetical protein